MPVPVQSANPSLLPSDRVRVLDRRDMRRVDRVDAGVAGVAVGSTSIPTGRAGLAACTIASFAFLVARYCAEDEVTVDVTEGAMALLSPALAAAGTRGVRYRLSIAMDAGIALAELVRRLVDAAASAAIVPEGDPRLHAGVVFDTDTGDDTGVACDIRVGVDAGDDTVGVALTFDALAFDHAIVMHFCDAGMTIVEAASANPHQPLDTIPLVGESQRRVMDAWNATAIARDSDVLLHDLIVQQAMRTPSAIAAEQDGVTMSYRELDARTGTLAATLVAHGVGQSSVVGVCLERSFDMLVAILAVLRAGGAYLPIDTSLPNERVAFMLDDSGCSLVLTHEGLAASIRKASSSVAIVDLSMMDHRSASAPVAAAPSPRGAPEQLAYVMYTSGSTGRPKGVMVPHRAVCNHVVWFADRVAMTVGDRVLQSTSISFDASVPELFAPLVVGATIVLAPRGAHRDLIGLTDFAASAVVTVMQFVPSTLRVVVTTPSFARLSTLRFLVSGGEALDAALASAVYHQFPTVRLGNFYGPTEATVDALAFDVPRDLAHVARVPIGTPVANGRCRILDAHGAVVPIGMPGELHVGGMGLAHGYINLPERTTHRFVPDPWLLGERLFRTGDLARYRADGTVECLGRIDTQLKLRGYRIEPSEVEAPLKRHPGVRDVVVVLGEDRSGDPQLVAHVVPDVASDVTIDALRQTAQATLPPWMVPSAFCFLDALPVTNSGKLDRRALPSPSDVHLHARAAVGSLEDALERGLQVIWEDILGISPIGPDDDFFALGGHSLKAIRLLAEVERVHGVALRAATLFEAPTVRALAARMRMPASETTSTIVRVQPGGKLTPLFLVPGGGGELFIFEALARALGSNQPFYIIDIYVFDEIVLPVATVTLTDVAARILVDIRNIQPHGPYQIAGYSLGGNISIEIAQQLRGAGEEVHLLALLDCDGPDYPVVQPLLKRTMTHIRHALALTPSECVQYLRRRVGNLARRVLPTPPPASLYSDHPESDLVPAQMIKSLERALRPVLRAWENYRPSSYDGRTLIVRADIRFQMIGVDDDDPWLGWRPVLRGEVMREGLACDHFSMLHAVNAPAFVAMLEPYLIDAPVTTPVRRAHAP